MARTYPNTPVLSKIQLPSSATPYYIKDADARAILDAIDAGIYDYLKIAAGDITKSQDGLAVISNIKGYIDQIAERSFEVIKLDALPMPDPEKGVTWESIFSRYRKCIVLIPNAVDPTVCDEYVIIRTAVPETEPVQYTYKWEQIGTSAIDLSQYVKKTFKIAGLTLENDITVDALLTALGLNELECIATASGSYTPEGTISAVAFTPRGTISTTGSTATVTSTGAYTPSGSISGDAISGGSINVTLGNAAAQTSITDFTYGSYTPDGAVSGTVTPLGSVSGSLEKNNNGVQISGTIENTSISITPSTSTVKEMKTEGTAYSITDGSISQPTITTGSFPEQGLVWAYDNTDDAGNLTLSYSTKANVVTNVGNIGYTAPVLSGALPTFGDSAAVMTGASAAFTNAPTFVGDKFAVNATFAGQSSTLNAEFSGTPENIKATEAKYYKQVVASQSFTPVASELSFVGSEKSVSVSGTYNTFSNAQFVGTAESITPIFTGTPKAVVVTPDVED